MEFATGLEPSVHPLVADDSRSSEDVATEASYQPAAVPQDTADRNIFLLLAISAGAGAMLGWIIKRRM